MSVLLEYKRFFRRLPILLILVVLSIDVRGLGYEGFHYGENHLRRKHSAEVEVLLDVEVQKFTSERGPVTDMAVVKFKPGEIAVYPVFQKDIVKSWGMLRDKAPMHFRYQLEDGEIQDVDDWVPDYENIRKDVWTIEQHFAQFKEEHPDLEVVGYVGNGNILANTHLASYVNGKLYAVEQEKDLIHSGKSRVYPSLILWKDGRFSIEEVRWTSEERVVSMRMGEDITDEVRFTNSGIGILKDGEPYDLAEHYEHDHDIRHYLDFPFIPTGNVHFGVNLFYDKRGRVKQNLIVPAIEGKPITLELKEKKGQSTKLEALTDEQIEELDENLRVEKGYEYKNSKNEVKYGSYFIDRKAGVITIGLKRGINPHNICGIDKDGNLVSIVVAGKSNRIGITFKEAQKKLKEMGIEDAIIFDNGADAMMYMNGDFIIRSFQNRERLLSILIFARPGQSKVQAIEKAIYSTQHSI